MSKKQAVIDELVAFMNVNGIEFNHNSQGLEFKDNDGKIQPCVINEWADVNEAVEYIRVMCNI